MKVDYNDPEILFDDPEDFANIESDSKMDTRATHSIQIPPMLTLNNCI